MRLVQCTHSYKWDQHSNLEPDHRKNAREVDLPIAGLLVDLQRRGLLEDTLVWWGGDLGRTPTSEGGTGRDHDPHAFTHLLAGGGVRSGRLTIPICPVRSRRISCLAKRGRVSRPPSVA